MSEKTITCLNGEFLPSMQACVPVADRGFRFGDGVFETIQLLQGVPYLWEQHLARLQAGLNALRIALPQVDWQPVARQLIQHNGSVDGFLRIAVSRGVGSRGYLPEVNITPTWVMEYLPPSPLPSQPLKLWLSTMERPSPRALPTNYKLAHGINSTLALLEAQEQGCDDAVMLSSTQKICETSNANIFWIKGGVLFTPTLETGCLAGTTRAQVLALSPLPYEELQADIAELQSAEAVFVTNARVGIWPVDSITPLGLTYTNTHPALAELTHHLEAHRKAYVVAHSATWAI